MPDPEAPAREAERIAERRLGRGEADYPVALLDLPDPPRWLHVRGALPRHERSIAIVGSRAATGYGRLQAHRLASDLAGLGFAIVSGLARGIDAAAHAGALEAGGTTVAVLPAGLDQVTPRHHRDLAESIAARGAWVSEMPSGTRLARGMFIRRNRLIAALARATVVIEAAERSGALSTAAAARRLARPVLAVPGDVDRAQSRGCHALLKSGARLCEAAADVLEALPRHAGDDPSATETASPAARLARALEAHPRSVEELARAADLDPGEALAALLALEWNGLAVSHPGQRWARRTGARA